MITFTSGWVALNLRTSPSIVRPSGPLNMFQKRTVTAPPPDVPKSSHPLSASDDAAPSVAPRNTRRGIDRPAVEVGPAPVMPLYVSRHDDDCEAPIPLDRRRDSDL